MNNRLAPRAFLDVQHVGATLAKTVWPGAYTNTLPTVGSGSVANVTSSGNPIGAIIAPALDWNSLLLDFAAVGAADLTVTMEIGALYASGAIAVPLATVTLKSVTNSGTIANVNPFTGVATASTTWRLFDLATLSETAGQVRIRQNGSENDNPVQLEIDTRTAPYFYIIVTNLGTMTRLSCTATPLTGDDQTLRPVPVKTSSVLKDLTFSLDTNAYASGDVIAEVQALTNVVRVAGGAAVLQDLVLLDEDDQGVAMTLYFFDSSVTLGTENGAPSLSDADSRKLLACVDIASGDWKDLGGVRAAFKTGIGAVLQAVASDIYVGIVNGTGTPTFTASGLKGRFKFLQD